MIPEIIGAYIVGIFMGFTVSVHVMRWAVSDLRERANRSTMLMKQYKEESENLYEIIRKYRREPSLQHPVGQWLEAQARTPDNCCMCPATEEGEDIGWIGWVACPESCCERPDHSHQKYRVII